MKRFLLPAIFAPSVLSGQTVLFQDNFDTADTANFDAAPTTGRLSGTLAADVVLRSFGFQQDISGNQLLMPNGAGGGHGVRFENAAGPFGGANRFDWAAGDTGSAILDAGGFTVAFDVTHAGNTTPDWVSFQVGTVNADSGNLTNDDYGILFRQNGNTERFDNGTNLGAGGSFSATLNQRHIEIQYEFSSFADGASVTATSFVDGVQVASDVFTWDGNGGQMRMELGHNDPGALVDNLTVSLLGGNAYFVSLDDSDFNSGDPQRTVVGTLSATAGGNPDPSTFALVAGAGDTDNDKFQINGSNLEVGSFVFTGAGSTHNQEFSIRVQGSGTTESTEQVFLVTVYKDDDLDNLLDDWELTWAADLTALSGALGTENADGDGLTDLEEFQISEGLFPDTPAYPNINPTEADSDGDTLDDDEELNPTAPRVVTDPGNADTDLDGLSDLVETNTGAFVDANNTGTNPTLCDTDGDHARDSWEITYSTDPTDGGSHPGSVSSSVTIVPITDDASSDIDASKTYTHAISGGNATIVNGVNFDVLSSTIMPANLLWDTNGFTFNEVVQNNGDWLPGDGGVTGPEIISLLDSFSYSSTGAAPGASQRYTLTGLTPGVNYDLRLYVRMWDTEGSSRPIDLIFTNGTEVVQPYGALPEDRPGALTGTGNHHEAYYLNFNYTAQGTELVIDATIADCNPAVSGSYHLYGLTNEVTTGATGLTITNTVLTPSGQFVIAFLGRPSTTYQVTKSPDLATPFVALDTPLSVTTDFTGAGQAVIPAAETGDPKYFFRIE
ncbi:MAG: hypothetical protein ACON5N_13875 [Akkermansiaceae bacterium]